MSFRKFPKTEDGGVASTSQVDILHVLSYGEGLLNLARRKTQELLRVEWYAFSPIDVVVLAFFCKGGGGDHS